MGRNAKLVLIILLCILAAFAVSQIIALYWGSPDSGIGFRITLVHANGSIEVIDSRDSPQAVLINPKTGLPVETIQVELYIKPVFYGKIASYACQGSLRMQIIEVDTGTVCYTQTQPLMQLFSPNLESGKAVVISSATVQASVLESLYSGWKEGKQYKFVYICDSLTCTVEYVGGKTETVQAKNLPAKAEVVFTYTAGMMTDLQVNFNIPNV